jgi:hypothetical protein
MNRDYADGTAEGVEFFTGVEVEHSPAYGMETLFVTGVHSADTVIATAKENNVKHIYFGANQSFKTGGVNDAMTWGLWEKMITPCLKEGFWCTLDFDVKEAEGIHESPFCEYRKFIPMISVKLPYLTQFNYNATIKIDDKDFEATNPGVWTHRLHDLLDSKVFTDWDQYKDDEIK